MKRADLATGAVVLKGLVSGFAVGLLALGLCLPGTARGATVTVINNDGAGEGFNDPTPVAPIGGNPGTTLGGQRLNAFQYAADLWGAALTSAVPIRIAARFNPMGGSATSATLGSCGPAAVFRDFVGASRASTWYVSAQASSLAGSDVDGSLDDMSAQFNSDVDNGTVLGATDWYYGYDGNAGYDVEFLRVVRHEIGHGLGFLSLVSAGTGAKLAGYDDAYMVHLENHATGVPYPAMTDAERLAANTSTGNLHWTGPNVVALSGSYVAGVHATGHVQMYAPNPYQAGSSVSHFDTALSPNELMEPSHTVDSTWDLTLRLLSDLGWPSPPGAPTVTGASPASGPTAGGTAVTITGTDLIGATGVSFGGTAATSVSVVDATTVTCVTPAMTAGAVEVAVTTPGGEATLTDGYTYSDTPMVTVAASEDTATEAGTTAGQFAVTRTGSTAVEQTVYFAMSGSAEAGVDYASTGAQVTIAAGAATAMVTVTPVDDASHEGDESVVLTLVAAAGYAVGTPSTATVTIQDDDPPTVTLAEAVDQPLWTLASLGTPEWVALEADTHDGVDAARSGHVADAVASVLSTTRPFPAGGRVSFWWKVSSEAGHDFLRFLVDGVVKGAISGEVDWQSRSWTLSPGEHVLTWEFSKDASASSGHDAGWLDQIEFVPLTVTYPSARGIATDRGRRLGVKWLSGEEIGPEVRVELFKGVARVRNLAATTANDGGLSWRIPLAQTPGTDYKIRVKSVSSPVMWDLSDSFFTIRGDRMLTLASPTSRRALVRGESCTIRWRRLGEIGPEVALQLYKGRKLVRTIAAATPDDGSFAWRVPGALAPGGDYRVRVVSTTYPAIWDFSNAYLAVQ